MADNVTLDPGSGGSTVATDDVGGFHYQRVKLTDGTADSSTVIAAGGGVESAALRVTVASDSTGVLSVDDNGSTLSVDDGGGSLTVDGSVSVSGAVDTELTTADLDTGAGTDTRAVVGLALAASGGAVLAGSANPVPVSDNSGSLTVDNAGTFAVQVDGNALTSLQLIDDTVVADDAAFTVATTKVNMAGFLADQASTDSVNEGDAGAARMTLDRKQIVTLAPSADTEGLSVSNNIDIDESEDAVKASAGKLYGYHLYNSGASAVYVKFYNDTVANVTVGTTTPLMTIALPGGSAANVEWTHGIAFSAAITVAATTGVATADTGAPAANQVVGMIVYQ